MKNVLIEMMLVSGLMFAYYLLFLRNSRYHVFNRYYLLALLTIPAIIPFLHIELPAALTTPIGKTLAGVIDIRSSALNEKNSSQAAIPFTQWLFAIYIAVAIVLLGRIIYGLFRMYRMFKTGIRTTADGIVLIETTDKRAPFTFFNYLFWNSRIALDSAQGRQILQHESIHIKRGHTLDLLLAETIAAIGWINPIFLLAKRELKIVHEFEADQFGTDASEKAQFARLLIMQAMDVPHSIANQFGGNAVSRRISMLAGDRTRKNASLQKYFGSTLALFTVLFFSFDNARVIQSFARNESTGSEKNMLPHRPANDRPHLSKKSTAATATKTTAHTTTGSTIQQHKFSGEIHLLNYHNESVAYNISMPENNQVPDFVHTRSAVTQVLIENGPPNQGPQSALFYPAPQYDEITLLINKDLENPLAPDWQLQVTLLDAEAVIVKKQTLTKEIISGFEAVRIPLSGINRGTYLLRVKSSNAAYASSCTIVKDYD